MSDKPKSDAKPRPKKPAPKPSKPGASAKPKSIVGAASSAAGGGAPSQKGKNPVAKPAAKAKPAPAAGPDQPMMDDGGISMGPEANIRISGKSLDLAKKLHAVLGHAIASVEGGGMGGGMPMMPGDTTGTKI